MVNELSLYEAMASVQSLTAEFRLKDLTMGWGKNIIVRLSGGTSQKALPP